MVYIKKRVWKSYIQTVRFSRKTRELSTLSVYDRKARLSNDLKGIDPWFFQVQPTWPRRLGCGVTMRLD